MLYEWFSVAGCELISNVRANALTSGDIDDDEFCVIDGATLPATLDCPPCPGLEAYLATMCGGDPVDFSDPETAPWFDPARPHTRNISGIVGLDVYGTSSAIWGDSHLDGESATGRRREVEIRFAVLARNQIAASEAMSWIASRWHQGPCSTTCVGADLCFFAGCPPDGDFVSAMRIMPDTHLVSGPDIENKAQFGDGSMIIEASMVVASRSSSILSAPLPETYTLTTRNARNTIIDLNPDCPEPDPCGLDPDIPTPVLPDIHVGWPSPGWPTDPISVYERTYSIADGVLPRGQVALKIDVHTGRLPLRNIGVRVWERSAQQACTSVLGDEDADCDACSPILISYVPPLSTATVDASRRHRHTVCVDGGAGTPRVWGPLGTSLQWPVINCGPALCLQIFASTPTETTDWSVSVELVPLNGAV